MTFEFKSLSLEEHDSSDDDDQEDDSSDHSHQSGDKW